MADIASLASSAFVLGCAIIWTLFSLDVQWPNQPSVFGVFTFGDPPPVELYLGESPGKVHPLPFYLKTDGSTHYAPYVPGQSSTARELESNPTAFTDNLFYRAGQQRLLFAKATSYALSERRLVNDFSEIAFCGGYMFATDIPGSCFSGQILLDTMCASTPIQDCAFQVLVVFRNGSTLLQSATVSPQGTKHIFPDNYQNSAGTTLTLSGQGLNTLQTNISISKASVEFSTASKITLSLAQLRTSFVHYDLNGRVLVYQNISDDNNIEALIFSTGILFIFAVWVHISGKITEAIYILPTQTLIDTIIENINAGIKLAIILNTSLSLALSSFWLP